MLKAILFDLDDTLLGNPMESFMPAYFQGISSYAAHLIPPERLLPELMRSSRVMMSNDGSGPTNEEVFAAAFYPALGYERAELEPVFERFYADEFPKLQSLTQRRPEARDLVEWAFERGLQVVIATNPLFPRTAIEQRLDWAGVPVTEFDYDLVTTYEYLHATKDHPAYYREVLAHLGRQPDECLMVGDNWEWDVATPASLGIPAYWIAELDEEPPADDVSPVGQGMLADLWEWIRAGIDFFGF
ncbi:MAG: HAD family hydrolase [Chloroflexi bacterium]|nr:MAG: HAD family hydrolase [Chloroflexota bacterium]